MNSDKANENTNHDDDDENVDEDSDGDENKLTVNRISASDELVTHPTLK